MIHECQSLKNVELCFATEQCVVSDCFLDDNCTQGIGFEIGRCDCFKSGESIETAQCHKES